MSIFKNLLSSSSSTSQHHHTSDSSSSRRTRSSHSSAFAVIDDDTSGLGAVELLPRAYMSESTTKLSSSRSLPLSLASYVKNSSPVDQPRNPAMKGARKKMVMQQLSENIVPKDEEKFISVAEARYLASRCPDASSNLATRPGEMLNVPPMITARPVSERTAPLSSLPSSLSPSTKSSPIPQRPNLPSSRFSSNSLLPAYSDRSFSAEPAKSRNEILNMSLPSSARHARFRPEQLQGDPAFVQNLSSKLTNVLLTPPTSPTYESTSSKTSTQSHLSLDSSTPSLDNDGKIDSETDIIIHHIARILQPSAPSLFTSDFAGSILFEKLSDSSAMAPVWVALSGTGTATPVIYETIKMKGDSSNARLGLQMTWWGYNVHFPKQCLSAMESLSAQETSQCVRNTLERSCSEFDQCGGSTYTPASSIRPFISIIAAYTAYRWQNLRENTSEDGCVLSATWISPTSVIPRHA